MVGRRNPISLLQCNTYLRLFTKGQQSTNVCVDPGSRFDFGVVKSNIEQLVGDLGEIDLFTLNHQDPDVVGNSPLLCTANPNVGALMTEETWRLVQHLDFQPGRVRFSSSVGSRPISLGNGHHWVPVPTPFCHFRGAEAWYDPEIRTLFSGDLFGGLNQLGRMHLLAEEGDWAGIAQFHQIYMPTREALRYAVRQIRALRPRVEVIAPQHGYVIAGELVDDFLDRMHELLVGHDLLATELDEACSQGYGCVLSRLIDTANDLIGQTDVLRRLKATDRDDGLEQYLTIRGTDVRLDRHGYGAISTVVARLAEGQPLEVANELRSEVLQACTDLGLPIPPVGAGLEQYRAGSPIVDADADRHQDLA
jgi:hypothetical protein